MDAGQRIVVAGGSLAGHSAVAELLISAPASDVVWITGEEHRAYSKPALSKEFMQARNDVADLTLPGIDGSEPRLRVIAGRQCVSLDAAARSVTLSDGETLGFDQLLIATGANARMPAMLRGIPGVFPLRTLDDAVAIRSRLSARPKVLVVGGGLIGCELAASMRTLGLDVTLAERLPSLLDRPFGGALSAYFQQLHERNGVRLHMDVAVESVAMEGGTATGATLSDGTVVEAGLVLVGAGSEPATGWLNGSGIALSEGIVCDSFLATSHPGIHAAGDVARWLNPIYDLPMRVEHWTNASAQGRAAARNIAAAVTGKAELRKPFGDVPYFWSDQYGHKIQIVGWHQGHDRLEVEQPADAPGPMVKFYRNGALIAAAGVNMPRVIMRLRRQIEEEARASGPQYANVS